MIPDTTPVRLLLLVALVCAAPATGQVVGDCLPGTAEADLDINDVRAKLFNGGNLFYGGSTTNGLGYLVPKSEGSQSPIFVSDLWVGGKVNGELRVAGSRYQDFEFWPGPLDEAGNPPEDCSVYDRIYRISRSDVARYLETGKATDDLRDWPVELGAPVLDGDGVEGNYNLAGGDEPAISGEQMAWWVMNDAGNEHVETQTPPIQIQARVSAFAVPSSRAALNQATLYRYRFTYRGSLPLDSAFVAFWTDADLGGASDDFMGSDTTLHMGFAYNQADMDAVYGVPPALGVKVIQGPVGLPNKRDDDHDGAIDESRERLGMTAAPCFSKLAFSEPDEGAEYYNCMRGLWADGTPITGWGSGYGSDWPVTTFMWPGDPVTSQFWSEENPAGDGNQNPGRENRFAISTGPFRLEPGESTEIVLAIPFAQGTDRLDSVVKLREAARFLQNAYDVGFFDPQRVGAVPPSPSLPDAFGLSRPFPNPFGASTSLTLTVPEEASTARLSVFDVLGREVIVLAEGVLAPGEQTFTLDGAGLPAGLYLLRLATARQTQTLKVLHVD